MRSGQVWPRASQVQGHKKQLAQSLKEQSALGEDETEKAGDNNGRQPSIFERPWIGPAAARSIKEAALLEFLESPVILNIQADERASRIGGPENASVLAWPSGMVISILTLGWLASHQR